MFEEFISSLSNDPEYNFSRAMEYKLALEKAEVDSCIMSILCDAHKDMVENQITSLEDYQSAKAVVPANTAKTRILNFITFYPQKFGVKCAEDLEKTSIMINALSGGPQGLYLMADVCTVDGTIHRWMFPPQLPDTMPDAPPEKTTSNVKVKCIGCMASYDSEIELHMAESFDAILSNGSDFVVNFVVESKKEYIFKYVVINGTRYEDLNIVNDTPNITLAECTEGYKLVINNVAEDTEIEFVCAYNADIKTFRISGDYSGCTTDSSLPTIVNEGRKHIVIFEDESKIKELSHISVNGTSYTELYKQGVSDFRVGTMTHTLKDDYKIIIGEHMVMIEIAYVARDYHIECHFRTPSYTIYGKGEHVTMEPNPAEVLKHHSRVITLTPEDGYRIESVECEYPFTLELDEYELGDILTFEDITANIEYFVNTKKLDVVDPEIPEEPTPVTYTVQGYGDNVTITDALVTVNEGENVFVTLDPHEGYEITGISCDEEIRDKFTLVSTPVEDGEGYISTLGISEVDRDIIYTVLTREIPEEPTPEEPDEPIPEEKFYTITGTGDEYITLQLNPVTDVAEGSDITIPYVLVEGYRIASVECSREEYTLDETANTISFNNVNEDITYSITTEEIPEEEPPVEEIEYVKVTTNIGHEVTGDHNIVVLTPTLTVEEDLYTYSTEKNKPTTMTLESGYTDDNNYFTELTTVVIKTSESETIGTANVSNKSTETVNSEIVDAESNVIGMIESIPGENKYTYNVEVYNVSADISIAFGTTNTDIGQKPEDIT